MKITRLKLVNFIGIKHGLDRDEIEIDFTKTDKNIVMLNGGNGSGKSTILSQLHPLKDSFDDRKSVVLDGEDGLKEIDIEHNGSVYKIKHIYGKKAQSFFEKDGVELNENGGVRTFEALVESEFGLTKDYFRIGKIGSNTANFIDLTASERKGYISKFLPSISDYLDAFDKVKKRHSDISSTIKNLTADLSVLEQEDVLKTKLDISKNIVKESSAIVSEETARSAVFKADIERLTESLSKSKTLEQLDLDDTVKKTRLGEIATEARRFLSVYSEGENKMKVSDVLEVIDQKTDSIADLSSRISVLNTKNSENKLRQTALNNEIYKIESNLKELNELETVESFQNAIKMKSDEVEEIQKNVRINPIYSVIEKSGEKLDAYLRGFDSIKEFVIKYFNNLGSKDIVPTERNISVFIREDMIENIIKKQEKTIRDSIQNKELIVDEKTKELYRKQAAGEKYDAILNGRDPHELCDNPNCEFLHDAIDGSPESTLELENKIDKLKGEIESYTAKADKLTEVVLLQKTFSHMMVTANSRVNEVYNYFIRTYGTIVDFIDKNALSQFMSTSEEYVSEIYALSASANKIDVLNSEIENLKARLGYVQQNEYIKKTIQNQLTEKRSELKTIQHTYEENSESIAALSKELISERTIKGDFDRHISDKKEVDSIKTMLNNNSNDRTRIIEDTAQVNMSKKELEVSNNRLLEHSKKVQDAQNAIIRIQSSLDQIMSLKQKKETVEKDFNSLSTIRLSLDPNKGIPLYFIKAYLESTEEIANELLEIAFGDKFGIHFETSPSEFFIKVRAGENIKNDIKEASQGEVALTTISISLALIEQSLGKFNILSLDEIDGPLDADNRENFIDILNKQIHKLGIEQVFIISHNNAFDTRDIGLILLEGNTINKDDTNYMSNKDIVFDYDEN